MELIKDYPRLRIWLLMYAMCIAVGVAYIPGLHGPALLDDVPNLGPIVQWAQGESAQNPLLMERKAGPLGRPVALLSFMANAVTTGPDIWPMKLTNVVLHLATGLALFGLLQVLLQRVPGLSRQARILAFGASALWLALPQHIVTVLYAVQRMTILASLFSVLALWCYAIARDRMEGNRRSSTIPLVLALLLATLAALSKESALVLPLLLVIVEWAFFPPAEGQRRPAPVRMLILGGGVLPVVAALVWVVWHPEIVLRGYGDRDFTIGERMLTQFRVVWEYAYSTFLPLGRTANIYNDDYPLSSGLFDPPVTALALLGWILVGVFLWCVRRQKVIVAGILVFFAGHALESSVFPLEMYFVHRNYLPSMGLALAVMVALYLAWQRMADRLHQPVRLAAFSGGAVLVGMALATTSRAHLWGAEVRLLDHAEVNNPGSLRLRTDRLRIALETGNFEAAQHEVLAAYQIAPASERRTVRMWDLFAHCQLGVPVPAGAVPALAAEPAGRVTNYANIAMLQLRSSVAEGRCEGMDSVALGNIISSWADQSPQSPGHRNMWEARAVAATLYASAGQLAVASDMARRAFIDSHYRFDLGEFAFMLALASDDRSGAGEVVQQLRRVTDPEDRERMDALARMQDIQQSDSP